MKYSSLKKYLRKFRINNKSLVSTDFQDKIYLAEQYLSDEFHVQTQNKIEEELKKSPYRYDVINYLLNSLHRDTTYLEIGVRNLADNFDKINASKKYCVDPGYEVDENRANFKMTSDEFFDQLKKGKVLDKKVLFDVIFIDGLHLADQVEKDINNALNFLKNDGFLVLHDCNPPTQFNTLEDYEYRLSPSTGFWNGTTWKAFFNTRKRNDIYSCCIDSDWGVGVVSKTKNLGTPTLVINEYFEFKIFEKNRKESLNLMSFEDFVKMF